MIILTLVITCNNHDYYVHDEIVNIYIYIHTYIHTYICIIYCTSPLETRLLPAKGNGNVWSTVHSELNQNQTEILRHCAPAGARSAGGGSPVQVVDVYNLIHTVISNFRETFANTHVTNSKKKTGKRQQTVWGGEWEDSVR